MFAYQLLKVEFLGWLDKSLHTSTFEQSAMLLGDEPDSKSRDSEVSTRKFTPIDLAALPHERIIFDASELSDGEENFVCISYKEE